MYIRERLVVLYAKLYSYTGDLALLSGRFWQVLNILLSAPDPSMYHSGITSICHIASSLEGVSALLSRDTILRVWLSASQSPISERRIGLYVSLAQAGKCGLEDQAKTLFQRLPVSPTGRSLLCTELKSPFPEFLEPILDLLSTVCRYPWGISSVFGEPELAEFVLSRSARHNAEVCRLKLGIVDQANRSGVPLTQLLRARIAEYVAAGAFAPAMGQMEEMATENIN